MVCSLMTYALNSAAQCEVVEVFESCYVAENLENQCAITFVFSSSGDCSVENLCYTFQGTEVSDCLELNVALNGPLDSISIDLPQPGLYTVWATVHGVSSQPLDLVVNCYDHLFSCPNPFAVNYEPEGASPDPIACVYDTYICDCSANQHPIGARIYLGDGEYDNATEGKYWDGQKVDFSCNVWGFDCGDGNNAFDPYNVCEGNLPPNNGCAAPGCVPLTMLMNEGGCLPQANGIKSTIDIHFILTNGCLATTLYFKIGNDPEIAIDLLEFGGFGNEEVFNCVLPEVLVLYRFRFSTADGAVSPYFYMYAQDQCNGEETICDCAGNTWFYSAIDYLGDGFLNEGELDLGGYSIDFNCPEWGYDCGDGTQEVSDFCSNAIPDGYGCDMNTFIMGCDDPTACNFLAGAVGDGSCDYSCYGCLDAAACNYDPLALLVDGTCVFATPGYDCEGNCLEDSDGDGVCDALEVLGCTYDFACNYDPLATEEDGSCEQISCLGCTYPAAVNYDSTATKDDGSCEYAETDCFGDLSGDGQVSISDLLAMLAVFGVLCE